MEKIIKARKDHDCAFCDQPIKKGESCVFIERKLPKFEYDSDDWAEKQIGIEFIKYWHHLPELECYRCKDNPCEYTYYPAVCNPDDWEEPKYVCDNCGHQKITD